MKYRVIVNGTEYDIELEALKDGEDFAPKAAAPAETAAPAAAPAGAGLTVVAPVPGDILKCNAAVGNKVNKGDVLFVLEVMKSENNILAPQAGTITAVNASKGATVKTGDVLCVIG